MLQNRTTIPLFPFQEQLSYLRDIILFNKLKVPFINLSAQYLNHQALIETSIHDVLKNGKLIGGEKVLDFEHAFAHYYQSDHGVSVSNGTDALTIAIKSLAIKPDDEVITTAYSWIATANAISLAGGKPVFVDVEPETGLMDIEKIEPFITSKTVGILPVHLFGQMVNMARLKQIADTHGLWIVEDAAQAHGATFGGKSPGYYSQAACFSFYPTKQLGAYGDGGMIITHDPDFAEKCRRQANHGSLPGGSPFDFVATNSRLDTVQAAILGAKLPLLDQWISSRRTLADRYRKHLKSITWLRMLPENPEMEISWYLFPVFCSQRNELMDFLSQNDIETSTRYDFVIPKTPAYLDTRSYPAANQLAESILNLPLYPELSDNQQDYVIETIKTFDSTCVG